MFEDNIFTVSQINKFVSKHLRENFSGVFIQGEIAELTITKENWIFITLKDETSSIRCVDFGKKILKYRDSLKEGSEIIVKGTLSLFEKRATFQLILEDIKIVGDGDIYKKIEELKVKLLNKGYFKNERKKQPPRFPLEIGVVTSLDKHSMAYKDFLNTYQKRFPITRISLYDSKVQGENAEEQIIKGIKYFEKMKEIEVIIITRGGGSIEDLIPFNSEQLADTIYNSKKVIVSAVGHEGNVSISDLVADIHAITPTDAANILAPSKYELKSYLKKCISAEIIKSNSQITSQYTLIENLILRSKSNIEYSINEKIQYLKESSYFLKDRINFLYDMGIDMKNKMKIQFLKVKNTVDNKIDLINNKVTILNSINPLYILDKGYSIVYKNNKIIKSISSIDVGDIVKIKLAQGELESNILDKKDDGKQN